MNRITEISRQNIFDFIQVEEIFWAGKMDEVEFLSRMFDLNQMPSSDSRFDDCGGDIWQHRVNNYDWEDNWIYYDGRFNLLKCDDSIFLQFLCEILHPLVRRDTSEVAKLHQIFNDILKNDGFEIIVKTKISGKPLFAVRNILTKNTTIEKSNKELTERLNADYVSSQINLMESSVESAPHVTIGIAKELIETCCKKILTEREIQPDKKWDLLTLVKETNKTLELTPKDIPDEKKASKTIRTILGSLSAVVHGICELRNDYGSGHGKDYKFKGLGSRHAKLAAGAASTLAIFLLETHEIRENK
ncbi:MAG: abortive infection family protein [Bacteroidales bacterium]|nr:abortive infection family protein [Bacteroidales bacterium]